MPAIGPEFTTRKPRFNHVAMSLTADMLDDEHRKLRADFYGDVFGFYDIPMMTIDRKRQVFQVHNIEQFVFLIADDGGRAMECPRLDHFGLSVGAESELDDILARAKVWQARDDRVDIIDKHVDDHGMLAITSIYVRYLLPMMCEIQWWDYREPRPRTRPGGVRVTAPLRWGAFAPQGWKLEYTGWSAADAWDRTKELAQLTEELGYHHLWVYDHVETVPRREPTHVFEAFTTLAALAQHTTTIKLGQMVTCAAYRNAGLLAKEAACVDVFSGGRLILGIGAGWYEREYQAYGYPFPGARTRLAILEETVEVLKRLWTRGVGHLSGQTSHVRRRLLRPEAHPAAPRDLDRRWRRAGHAAHRSAQRRQDELADRPRGVRAKVEPAARLLRRDRPRLRLDRADPRSRLPRLRHRSRSPPLARLARRWIVVGSR